MKKTKFSQKLRSKMRDKRILFSSFLLVFTIFGAVALFISLAATSPLSIESESGTRTNLASIGSDATASGGAYVGFGSSSPPTNTFFPIGVDVQPTYSFATWKARGINTLIRVPDGHNAIEWTNAAKALGLRYVRDPLSNPASDKGDPLLFAWSLGDEPEIYDVTPAQLKTQADNLRAIDPSRKLLVNFAGGGVLGLQTLYSESQYRAAASYVDFVSNSIYPVAGWNQPNQLRWVGDTVARLSSWSNGKPQYAYIETSDQHLPWIQAAPGPTPAQVRAEIWDALIAGARGIWYFPVSISPFNFDNTPQNVMEEVVRQNALITSLSAPLLAPINPATMSATTTAPLKLSWRVVGNTKYVMVLNMSNASVSGKINLTGTGAATIATAVSESRTVPITASAINDSFGAYGVHVYTIN